MTSGMDERTAVTCSKMPNGVRLEERTGGEVVLCGEKLDMAEYLGPLWPYLRSRLRSQGQRIAVVNPYTGEEYSYGRVLSLAERLARGLHKLGLRQGRPLCVVAPNSVEHCLVSLATVAVGAVMHGVNPASMPGEIRRQVELTGAGIIVTVPSILAHVEEAVAEKSSIRVVVIGPRDGNLNYDDLLTLGTEDVTLPTKFGDPRDSVFALIFSSGTTGMPKGVEVTQRSVMAWFATYFSLEGGSMIRADDTSLFFVPLHHVFGLIICLLAGLARGTKLIVMEKFNMDNYLLFISKYKVSLLYLVPPVVIGMLNHPGLKDVDVSSVRRVICGAAPLGSEMQRQFKDKIGVPCLMGWGMTENFVTTLATSDKNSIGSSGVPLPNVELKVVDPESKKCLPANHIGDVYVRGPLGMRGYHKNPQATRDVLDDQGWLYTGDVARFDSDGFVYIVDRRKELIKYKGEQVPPAMLEDVLLSHPQVSDACVIGRPDPEAGELPMAYVVTAPGCTVTGQQVQDFVANKVPSYMKLRGGVDFITQIPKSPSGKILRRLLRDKLQQQQQQTA